MKKILWLSLVFCCGCVNKPKVPAVHIGLVNNNQSVKFTGLDDAIMGEINRDSVSDIWENLLPVYRMPADTDLKDYQPVQPGKYTVQDSVVIFTPDTPFQRGQAYFIRYYHFDKGSSLWGHIKDHQKLNSPHYTDLIFKQ